MIELIRGISLGYAFRDFIGCAVKVIKEIMGMEKMKNDEKTRFE